MKLITATVVSLSLLASACAHTHQIGAVSGADAPRTASIGDSQTISITRSGSQPSRQGPAENFTGSVRVDPCSIRTLRHARPALTSRLSPVPALHGIPIRSVRP